MKRLALIVALLLPLSARAQLKYMQDVFPAPVTGANCGASPNSCSTAQFAAPQTDGFAFQIQWANVESSQGVYNWQTDSTDFGRVAGYMGLTVGVGAAVRSGCPGSCSTTVTYTSPFGGNSPIPVGAKVLPLALGTGFNATVGSPFTVTATTGNSVTYVDSGSTNGSNATAGTIEIACRAGQRCLFTPIIVHISNGTTNSATPTYLGTVAGDDALVATIPWVNNHLYYNGDQVFFGGSYYQMIGIGSCTSLGANPPSDIGCPWNVMLHAAPQDFGFCTAFSGTQVGAANLPVNSVANVNNMTGGTQSDQLNTLVTGYTAMWETPANVAYNNLTSSFYSFLATQSRWNTRVLEVRFGLFKGGEQFLQCGPQFVAGQVPASNAQLKARFINYASNAFSNQRTFRNANGLSSVNMDMALNGGNNATQTCDWANAAAAAGIAAGVTALGNQGFSTADLAGNVQGPCTAQTPPGVAANWTGNFATYQNQLTYRQLQTQSQSCPTGAVDCTAQETSGSLTILLPFAAQHANVFEIYDGDWRATYDAAYTGPPTFAEAQTAGYPAAFAAARSQATFSTSLLGGKGRMAGGSSGGTVLAALSSNAYCGAGDVASFGGTDGPATLPTACIYTALAGTPSPGATHNIVTATDLTNCFAGNGSCPGGAPACGDVLSLQSGNSFSGNFTLGAWATCNSSNWVRIQSSVLTTPATPAFPPEQTRVNPSYAGVASLPGRPAFVCPGGPCANTNVMAQVIASAVGSNSTITLASGVAFVRFIGLEITRPTGGGAITNLVNLGTNHHIIFDRVWAHGTATDEARRFFDLNTTHHIAVIDSYGTDFHCLSVSGTCVDSQFVSGGGTNPAATDGAYKIVDNFAEGAAEGMEFGGGTASFTPCDIEVRLNHWFKPQTWNPNSATYNGGVSGHAWVVKNGWETKNSCRVLIEGNYGENVWEGFGQHGEFFSISPKNQTGNLCPLCVVSDIVMRFNYIHTASQWADLANVAAGDGQYFTTGQRYVAHDNIADNLMYPTRNGTTQNIAELNSGFPITSVVTSTGTAVVRNSGANFLTAWLNLPCLINAVACTISTVTDASDLTLSASAGNQNSVPFVASIPPNGAIQTNTTVTHNDFIEAAGASFNGMLNLGGPIAGNSAAVPQMANIIYTNNLQASGNGTVFASAAGGGVDDCSTIGPGSTLASMLSACWIGTTSFTSNAIVVQYSGGGLPAKTWPAGNLFPANWPAVAFATYANGSGGDYRLCAASGIPAPACTGASPYHNAASDGKDIGADVATVTTLTNFAK